MKWKGKSWALLQRSRWPGPKKIVSYSLVAILALLQYPLWFGNGGLVHVWRLSEEIRAQQLENSELKERNATLQAEVEDLKQGLAAIEERARRELGMVRKGETYYRVLPTPESAKSP